MEEALDLYEKLVAKEINAEEECSPIALE